MKFCWAVVPRDFLMSAINAGLQPRFQEPQMHQCTKSIFPVRATRWPVLGACREALGDSSRQVSSLFHAWILDPVTFCLHPPQLAPLLAIAAIWIPGQAFLYWQLCQSVFPLCSLLCQGRLAQSDFVNLLWIFNASLDLPIAAALIAPLLLVWLPGGSQPGPRDGKSS